MSYGDVCVVEGISGVDNKERRGKSFFREIRPCERPYLRGNSWFWFSHDQSECHLAGVVHLHTLTEGVHSFRIILDQHSSLKRF